MAMVPIPHFQPHLNFGTNLCHTTHLLCDLCVIYAFRSNPLQHPQFLFSFNQFHIRKIIKNEESNK